ncbi:hypothetical protein [Dietzia maris]|uniref:hypothetical protein n=1 Tax=Dietzia maris TaxID=37915 RepID=UPI0037CCAAC2
MAAPTIAANGACDLTVSGLVGYMKDADTIRVTASTIKCLTLLVARRRVTDAMLPNQVEVISADLAGGSTAGLQAGDLLSWNDLFHGLMLPSGNDAAKCIARNVGQIILDAEAGSGDPTARFLTDLNHVAATVLGWSGTAIDTVNGDTIALNNRISPRQLCQLALALDDYSVTVSGTWSHTVAVTGPNARTINLVHTFDKDGEVPFPEVIAVKTGTLNGDPLIACVVMLWVDDNGRHATAVMESPSTTQRLHDARAIIDYVKVLAPPPLPPVYPPPPVVFPTTPPVGYRTKVGETVVDIVEVKIGVGGQLVHVWP